MLAQLFALLLYAEADIVCLQEVGPVPHDAFAGFPYKAWWGPPMVNGGVAALLHVRYGVGTTRAILQPHYVVISHPVTPHSPSLSPVCTSPPAYLPCSAPPAVPESPVPYLLLPAAFASFVAT